MKQPDNAAEFKSMLSLVADDISQAEHYYSSLWGMFESFADDTVLAKVNENSRYWSAVLNALQAALFSSIGRLYDTHGGHGLRRSMTFAINHAQLFSRQSIADRKRDDGLSQQLLSSYVVDIPLHADAYLRNLREELDDWKVSYDSCIGPIRNRVIGHTLHKGDEDRRRFYKMIDDGTMLRLIAYARNLHSCLWMLFHNGRHLELPLDVPLHPDERDDTSDRTLPFDRWELVDEARSVIESLPREL